MCGIFGVINSSRPHATSKKYTVSYLTKGKEFIEQGFITSGVRGLDSSGIFQVDSDGTKYMHKLPVCGSLFIEDKATRAFLNDADSSPLTVCHVRAATQGRVHLNNAHPFQVWSKDKKKNIIGVHNGTINGWQAKAGKDSSLYGVDSEWLLAHIAEEGADAFETISNGSFSLVWVDSDRPDEVLFARNKERPMHFVRSKDKRHVLFGSEAGMLTWLAERNGIDLEEHVYSTADDRMYSIDFSKEELLWKDLGLYPTPKPVVTKSSGSYKQHVSADGEWDYEWGHGSSANYEESEKSRRTSMIQSILGALKSARNDTPQESVVKDDPSLDGDYIQVADSSWFTDTLATYAEKKHAKKYDWYGDVVEFQAVELDQETFELIGDIQDAEEQGVMYSGVMRNVPKIDYERHFKDKISYAVIIGSRETKKYGTEFILSPLTEAGRREFSRLYTE